MKKEHIAWFDKQAGLMQGLKEHTAELYDMLEDVDPPPPPPVDPERKDTPWWPNRMTTAGVTAFPLTVRSREYIRDLVVYLKEHGYNSATIGAQSWSFGQSKNTPMLPGGPGPGTKEWAENLETMLDETARHEDFWVQLIPTFGYKHYDTNPDGMEYQWHLDNSRKIYEIIKANGFKHVYISVMNEFKHPLTDRDLGDTDITRLGNYWQDKGFKVSTDHGGREKNQAGERIWRAYYPQAWLGFDYYTWHPTRNPEPSSHQFKRAADRWRDSGKALLYNETVCFADDDDLARYPHLRGKFTIAGKGKVDGEAQKWIIRTLKSRIRNAGERSRFFFHSIWLGIRGGIDTPLGWLPKY